MIKTGQTMAGLTVCVFSIFVFFISAYAENEAGSADMQYDNGGAASLGKVTVKGSEGKSGANRQNVKSDRIESTPARNSSINDVIGTLSNVQTGEGSFSSSNGGEIKPSEVSISGGKTYQNNVMIDGMSINNRIDPAADNPSDFDSVASHSQTMFIDPRVLGSITVYDSNVPAGYGGFSGGVVASDIRKPLRVFSGRVDYRTTNHNMTSIHVHESEKYTFEHSYDYNRQPEFYRHDFISMLDVPLGDEMGLMLSYSLKYSQIPLEHLGEPHKQSRSSQSFIMKYEYDVSDSGILDLQFIYAPYEGHYFTQNAKNSDYTLSNDSISFRGSYKHDFDSFELDTASSFQYYQSNRDSPQHWFLWAKTKTKDWGSVSYTDEDEISEEDIISDVASYSSEGGYGSINTGQMDWSLQSDLKGEPFSLGPLKNTLSAGFKLSLLKGWYDRPETTYVYKGAAINDLVTGDGSEFDYVTGEQYFSERNVYEAGYSEAAVAEGALYAQYSMDFFRLNVTPGLRVSYDEFMGNVNPEPRLSLTFDIFGSGMTKLITGANRYYDLSVLTYKLREAVKPYYRETRTTYQNRLEEWTRSAQASNIITDYSRLETPYADEYNAGFEQKIFRSKLSGKVIVKKFKDQFAMEATETQNDGKVYVRLNNRGRSAYTGLSASWEMPLKKHYLAINATWSKSTTSNENYDVTVEDEEALSYVWYRGEIIRYAELPRQDFNRPFVVNLLYVWHPFPALQLSAAGKYRSSYIAVDETGEYEPVPDGSEYIDDYTGDVIREELAVYEEIKMKNVVTFDVKIRWEFFVTDESSVSVYADITNIFNSKSLVAASSTEYEMGRQIWLGAEYSF